MKQQTFQGWTMKCRECFSWYQETLHQRLDLCPNCRFNTINWRHQSSTTSSSSDEPSKFLTNSLAGSNKA